MPCSAVRRETQLLPLPSPRVLNDKMYVLPIPLRTYVMPCLSVYGQQYTPTHSWQ